MKIRITIPGGEEDEVVHQCDGPQAVIGRSPSCDVTVPIRHVSGQHVMVVQGLAVIDLKSTNGTFVAGTRIETAAAVPGGRFMLGSEVEVVVESDMPAVDSATEPIDFEATLLSDDDNGLDLTPLPPVATQPKGLPATPGAPVPIPAVRPTADAADQSAELGRQQAENDDLRRRIESLK
ncbi:MAG: FHA domain-containing protein, partial [Planctomycetota bacterium]|nr:FHA domain-containing protein [Planctomycetota bacterium]